MQTLKEPFLAKVTRLDEEGQSIASPIEGDLSSDAHISQDNKIYRKEDPLKEVQPPAKPLKISFKGALPGEEVLLQPLYKKYRTLLASLLDVATPSPDRVKAPCTHFLECGGCSFQHLRYQKQLQMKQGKIEALFQELLPEEAQIMPILPSQMEWGYRGKMEFTFNEDKKGQKYLGLYGEYGKVLARQTECPIAPPWMSEALEIVRLFWEGSPYHAFYLSKSRGMDGTLRYLTLRGSFRTPAKMVILSVFAGATEALSSSDVSRLKEALQGAFGDDLSFYLKVDRIVKGSPSTFSEMHIAGPDALRERLVLKEFELQCRISPASFYQPNPSQAEIIYQIALDLTEELFLENKIISILDLFSGIGMLGLVFAARAKRWRKSAAVTCVELSPYACMDGEEMITLNGLDRSSTESSIYCEMIKADAFIYLQSKQGIYDLVIVDPPRAGLDQALLLMGPLQAKYILYISCNPKSQATDIQSLMTLGYKIVKIQPIDQFPHTPHLENVILLAK